MIYLQIGVVLEEDPEHIPSLPFIPVDPLADRVKPRNAEHAPIGPSEHRGSTGHRVRLARIRLDPDSARMAGTDAQQVVDHLEALLPLREIDTANIHDALELALRVITEECEHRDDAGGGDVEC